MRRYGYETDPIKAIVAFLAIVGLLLLTGHVGVAGAVSYLLVRDILRED